MIAARLKKNLSFYEATSALVGTIIGAGVLGLPFVVLKVGFLSGAVFMVVMAIVVLTLHLMLGEVVAATREPLQLAGLARKYLGKAAGRVMGATYVFSLTGVLLAYIVGEGDILSQLLPGSSFKWSIIFFVMGALVIFKGVTVAKHISLFLTGTMITILVAIIILAFRHFSFAHVGYVSFEHIFLPFGVILFALSGVSALPLVEVIDNKKRELKKVIILGSLIPAVLYFFFALAVVGVTGLNTTEVATVGLGRALGPFMVIFGGVFGIFSMGSGFIFSGLALTCVYDWDFGLKRLHAALLACAVPLLLFLLGARHFITILGLVGSLFIALEMILIVLMFLKLRRSGSASGVYYLHHPRLWGYLLLVVLVCAGGLGVWQWLSS